MGVLRKTYSHFYGVTFYYRSLVWRQSRYSVGRSKCYRLESHCWVAENSWARLLRSVLAHITSAREHQLKTHGRHWGGKLFCSIRVYQNREFRIRSQDFCFWQEALKWTVGLKACLCSSVEGGQHVHINCYLNKTQNKNSKDRVT